jgi:2-phosphosulfolactate phosphatase
VSHGQSSFAIRFDWGLAGARAITADAAPGDVAVVVDVLSFTTTLSVAIEAGIEVFPYPWAADDAATYAEQRGAVLALGRRAALTDGSVSLSPASFEGRSDLTRVVLPSPNGSAICFALADSGLRVLGASLRNAAAVAAHLREGPLSANGRVHVAAAGERWPDGGLRPAVEDLWGAGAVLSRLDLGTASPEARSAAAAYDSVRDDLAEALPACASGQELLDAGFARDVAIAGQLDVSTTVPELTGEAFGAAR